MNEKKSIVFLIQSMSGGGAERVISLLSNELVDRSYDVTLIITHQSLKSANISGISNSIRLISLEDKARESSKGCSQTKRLNYYHVSNQPVKILDIPGFNDEKTINQC